jgi:hypothetical protein
VTTPEQHPTRRSGPPPDSTEPAARARKFALVYAEYEASDRKRTANRVAGTFVGCGAVMASVCGGLCAGGGRGAVIPVLALSLLVVVALKLRNNPQRGGWAAGIWIGIAVALLLEGTCWLAILRDYPSLANRGVTTPEVRP